MRKFRVLSLCATPLCFGGLIAQNHTQNKTCLTQNSSKQSNILGLTPSFRLGEKTWTSATKDIGFGTSQGIKNFRVEVLKDFYNLSFPVVNQASFRDKVGFNKVISYKDAINLSVVEKNIKFGFGKYQDSSKSKVTFGKTNFIYKGTLYDQDLSFNNVVVPANDIENPTSFSWISPTFTLNNTTGATGNFKLTYSLIFDDESQKYNFFDLIQISMDRNGVFSLGFNKEISFHFALSAQIINNFTKTTQDYGTFYKDNDVSKEQEITDNNFKYYFNDKTNISCGSSAVDTSFTLTSDEQKYFSSNTDADTYSIILDDKHFKGWNIDGTEIKGDYINDFFVGLNSMHILDFSIFSLFSNVEEPSFEIGEKDNNLYIEICNASNEKSITDIAMATLKAGQDTLFTFTYIVQRK